MKLAKIPLRIPALWDLKWFDRFVREALSPVTLERGEGVPDDASGDIGDVYVRTDGTDNNTLYIREPAGWRAL